MESVFVLVPSHFVKGILGEFVWNCSFQHTGNKVLLINKIYVNVLLTLLRREESNVSTMPSSNSSSLLLFWVIIFLASMDRGRCAWIEDCNFLHSAFLKELASSLFFWWKLRCTVCIRFNGKEKILFGSCRKISLNLVDVYTFRAIHDNNVTLIDQLLLWTSVSPIACLINLGNYHQKIASDSSGKDPVDPVLTSFVVQNQVYWTTWLFVFVSATNTWLLSISLTVKCSMTPRIILQSAM